MILLLLPAASGFMQNLIYVKPSSLGNEPCTQRNIKKMMQLKCSAVSAPTFRLCDDELGNGQINLDHRLSEAIRATAPECTYLVAPPKERVSVHRAVYEGTNQDFNAWGAAARAVIDDWLPKTGAVLFRNLPIFRANDFKEFWEGCKNGKQNDVPWVPIPYIPVNAPRAQLDGVDLATNIPPNMILPCHNELAYNPRPAGRIALYCLQEAAQGGETLVAWNSDITELVPPELLDFLEAHGGIPYDRTYHDAKQPAPNPKALSWYAPA